MTGDAFAALKEPKYGSRMLGSIQVKGKTKAVTIHEIYDTDPEPLRAHKSETVARFDAALALYRGRELERASREFAALLEQNSGDGPARFYLARCRQLIRTEVPVDWNGTIVLESK